MKKSYSQIGQDCFVLSCLKHKRNGVFLEIGSNSPIENNNSYLLEKDYNWTGLMVEYQPYWENEYKTHRSNSKYIIQDATQINFAFVFDLWNFPKVIDYLQIDLDVNNRSTLQTLKNINNQLMDKYKFATVTFEYTGDYFNTRALSREIFANRGYVRVFSDVKHNGQPCEDWYVHPDLIDMDYIHKIKSDESMEYTDILEKLHSTKRVALFFSGRITTYNKRHELKAFIDRNNIDCFASVNSNELDNEFINFFKIKNYYCSEYKNRLFKDFNLESLQQFIQLKDWYNDETNIFTTLSMFFNHKKNGELIEEYETKNGFKYDVIIFYRTDIETNIPYNINNFIYDNKYIAIPSGWDCRDGINGAIASGDNDSMKYYCGIYDNIVNIVREISRFHPERLIKEHLIRNKSFSIIRYDYNFIYDKDRFNCIDNTLNIQSSESLIKNYKLFT
jgi:hypothetical protein